MKSKFPQGAWAKIVGNSALQRTCSRGRPGTPHPAKCLRAKLAPRDFRWSLFSTGDGDSRKRLSLYSQDSWRVIQYIESGFELVSRSCAAVSNNGDQVSGSISEAGALLSKDPNWSKDLLRRYLDPVLHPKKHPQDVHSYLQHPYPGHAPKWSHSLIVMHNIRKHSHMPEMLLLRICPQKGLTGTVSTHSRWQKLHSGYVPAGAWTTLQPETSSFAMDVDSGFVSFQPLG